MLRFDCDYNNGCHPEVLGRLVATNGEYSGTYGADAFSEGAKARIRAACGDPSAEVFFLAGGTQTNATVIDCLLQPWQGVVAAETGHIAVHEAGAVEYTGHKVITLPEHDGRIASAELEALMAAFRSDETNTHMAEPALVYISFPTEVGTLYPAKELAEIHGVCRKYGMKLFVDGARLAYGLEAAGNDVSLEYLAAHCDAFYIGGTKCGALCGEAVVFPRGGAPVRFFTRIKQHGALLAKGRVTGVQFDALFTGGLYSRIGRHADELAMRLQEVFRRHGIAAGKPSATNQQFFILTDSLAEALGRHAAFEKWSPVAPGKALCRFVTSWATTEEDIDRLDEILETI